MSYGWVDRYTSKVHPTTSNNAQGDSNTWYPITQIDLCGDDSGRASFIKDMCGLFTAFFNGGKKPLYATNLYKLRDSDLRPSITPQVRWDSQIPPIDNSIWSQIWEDRERNFGLTLDDNSYRIIPTSGVGNAIFGTFGDPSVMPSTVGATVPGTSAIKETKNILSKEIKSKITFEAATNIQWSTETVRSFEETESFEIGASVTASGGIPEIAEISTTFDTRLLNSLVAFGSTSEATATSETTTLTVEDEIKILPGETVVSTLMQSRGTTTAEFKVPTIIQGTGEAGWMTLTNQSLSPSVIARANSINENITPSPIKYTFRKTPQNLIYEGYFLSDLPASVFPAEVAYTYLLPSLEYQSGDNSQQIFSTGNIQGYSAATFYIVHKYSNVDQTIVDPVDNSFSATSLSASGKHRSMRKKQRQKENMFSALTHGENGDLDLLDINGIPTKIGVHVETHPKKHANKVVIGTHVDDRFKINSPNITLYTHKGRDHVTGSKYPDRIFSSGSDHIASKSGNDVVNMSKGGSFVDAGKGDDRVNVTVDKSGVDHIFLGKGKDILNLRIKSKNFPDTTGFIVHDLSNKDEYRFTGSLDGIRAVPEHSSVHFLNADQELIGTFRGFGDIINHNLRDKINSVGLLEYALLNADKLEHFDGITGDLDSAKNLEHLHADLFNELAFGNDLEDNFEYYKENFNAFEPVLDQLVESFISKENSSAVKLNAIINHEMNSSMNELLESMIAFDQSL